MENLQLVEKHRKKIALLFALFIFVSLYTIVIVFQITSAFLNYNNENKILRLQLDRVSNVIEIYDELQEIENPNVSIIVNEVLKNTDIYKNWELTIKNIAGVETSWLQFWSNEIMFLDNHKYIQGEINVNDSYYQFIVRNSSESIPTKLWGILILFFVLWPLIYTFLAWIMCKVMHKVYAPLKETITNLESFATNINHEFKTTLTEIISSLELSEITWDYEDGNKRSIGSAKRLNNILDSLWMMIHFVNSDYRKEKINIVRVLDDSISDHMRSLKAKNIKIVKKYNVNDVIFKFMDRAPLVLTFNNIIKNAIRYSNEGWEIEICINKSSYSIKDYGVWIEKKNLKKIFDRYFRESYTSEWSGIGLSIIKRITEKYDWKIHINSEKWEYTEVIIEF